MDRFVDIIIINILSTMNIVPAETSSQLLDAFIFLFYELRAVVVGVIGVGLFIGALYFFGFLIHLSRLPRDDKMYKQQAHLLEPENLLRYIILIVSIVTLNVLFFLYFEFGQKCTKAGAIIWLITGGFYIYKSLSKSDLQKAK